MNLPPELITRVKRHIKHIGPLQLGVTLAVLNAILGLLVAPIIILSISLAPNAHRQLPPIFGIGMGLVIAVPIFYGVGGFMLGLISGAVYNLVAKMTGGIEVEVE
jgi:hypothetical protein